MNDITTLKARRDRALGAGAALFYETPLHIVRGEGAYLFDADGRRYVDMYNNVPCVGHANPRVAEAMARQQGTLNTHSRYLHEGIVTFAERLAALHGPQIESVVFSCSGTEANEVALRMARFATGRRGIVCTNATYHGNSELVGGLTHVGSRQPETAEVHAFPFPETYRPIKEGAGEEALCDAYLERLEEAITRFEASRAGFAALIVCSIFANEGLPNVPAGFMARAADMARAPGGLVIADEVQAGYGRTGRWWGYEVTGFTPDIVVTGKPMGNGLPLAATAASRVAGRDVPGEDPLFQHLRLQPAAGGGRHGGARRNRGAGPEGERHRRGGAAEGGPEPAQGRVGGHRGRAWRGPVHRRGDGEAGRGQGAGRAARRRHDQPAQGQGLPHQQRRRLRQRGEDPAAAGVLGGRRRSLPEGLRRDGERVEGRASPWMTPMDDEEAAETFLPAAEAALEAFPITPARLSFVNVSENVTFKVTDEGGEDFVLRLHRPWYHTHERLKGERVWTRALTAAGVSVPQGIMTRDGEDYVRVSVEPLGEQRWAGLARWIEGKVLFGIVEAETDPAAIAGHFERLGAIMAALHNQAAGWTPPGRSSATPWTRTD